MEIKYDETNSKYVCYNEAQGIYLNQKKILQGKHKIYTFCATGLLYLVYTLGFTLFYLLFKKINVITSILIYALLFMYAFLIFYFGTFVLGYIKHKKKNNGGVIVFDEEGITDISKNGIKVGFKWEKLKYVFFKEHTITFVFDNVPVIIFLDINKKDEVKQALMKYNKDNLIIEF